MPNDTPSFSSIKTIALYELIKGVLALTTALLLWYEQGKLGAIANLLTIKLHHLFGSLLAIQLNKLNDLAHIATHHTYAMLGLLMGYALMRFAESYGLYHERAWAYWFSLLGYGLFLPLELYGLFHKFDAVHLLVVLINLIILFIVYRQMRAKGLIA
ncbi:MAG: DUF2127 domain-containing protein [Moraxella sp.]|nr:DUF2127 domain-containing protein [Moraxella sp.]